MASVSPLPPWENRRRVIESVGPREQESHASYRNSPVSENKLSHSPFQNSDTQPRIKTAPDSGKGDSRKMLPH